MPENPPSRRARATSAGIAGALYGGAAGAALGGSIDGSAVGAAVGAVFFGTGEAITDLRRNAGQLKPIWWRILASAAIGALIGWVLDFVLPDWGGAVLGIIVGVLFGALGARPTKLLVGAAVGFVVGAIVEALWSEASLPWLAAFVVLAYRAMSALIFREAQTELTGERQAIEDIEFVVPFAAHQRYVGVDYLKRYADLAGADFVRSAPDIGIVARFDDLAGPAFDPEAANPLIREFYEHTSRFHLSITPEWRWWMRLPYLFYRTFIARPLGQANAPFDVDEVQEGVVSWIDAIDVDHSGEVDFRAWVRAYEESMEPLYVGIYTVLRTSEAGLVSVGFPLPSANFTATLLPHANRGDGLLLKSVSQHPYSGHYLSAVDDEHDELTTLKLASFDEEIDVFVEHGELKSEHRFYLWGIQFMVLHYGIERVDA